MAIRKIARMGHPVLRVRAEDVADPQAPEIRRLIHDMLETMLDADGLGIAAPQVYEPRRVVMFFVPDDTEASIEHDGEMPERELVILINPVLAPLTADTEEGWEGCLSVPGLRGIVSRPSVVRYAGLAPDGSAIDCEAHGMHARVVQHECDHLDGILYPQRMEDMSMLTFESEWKHFDLIADEDNDE
jgi:peptide deformylase